MFNSRHYVPILKWKRAEQGALKLLPDENKERITPLIQLVMPKYETYEELDDVVKKFEEQLPELAEKVIDIWGTRPIFIDVSLLFTVPLKAKSLSEISTNGYKLGGVFIPVIHLSDDQLIKTSAFKLAKDNRNGLCLRLICSDFSDTDKLHGEIADLVRVSGLEEKDIDLLVDIKGTEENGDKYTKYLQLSQNIPNLLAWRTFIFASGSFPKDLSECKLDEENLIPRIDWQSWKKFISSQGLKRKPTFSDYTIQHPIYKEVTQFFHPTASIKYAFEDEWLIMKGQKQKFDKYLASAALLAKDKRFYGEDFSYGDKYISEKAKHFEQYIRNPSIKGTGSTETWLRAGINHHLTLVAHQVANLP
ncbi:hypothetical protein A3A79_00820 [Candidatus Gottesmanbacteria bacterium RIFCSPLOWO2_01_FULL_43_11b]|uniref:T4 beta protein n=1 Tax=Candidatus Gottesmanbacteria bacterium RIFCSPLOWO2_01_FULL_43_11b TaxID=1798392 RepID=A0A1F6AGD3_9BACT|nr:MAG: hypothetical protein A3A79_00820 [Candidatus Gottesmanbacteria bacterium RIFCSPLOWO2_01_FULL_43_11b]